MRLSEYLKELNPEGHTEAQKAWFERLSAQVEEGAELFAKSTREERAHLEKEFNHWVRTEEIKAWYCEPDRGSLFQGTSVASLTIPAEFSDPLRLADVHELEENIADSYIRYHDLNQKKVRDANLENTDKWIQEGIFYGVVLSSKIVSQAFGLALDQDEVIIEVDGVRMDPHEILSYTAHRREEYFQRISPRIDCFSGLDCSRRELEESLVLADISKPKIQSYKGKLLLAPVRCNEICALLSRHVTQRIREKTGGRISPRSLMVTIYDSDTPYTYHCTAGFYGHPLAPTLPGLTLLGSSGTIDAFRWLYIYRTSLVSQKIMKGSLFSEVERRFTPFVFFGVLVERDAEILLNLDELGLLRYRGHISPYVEYCYLLPKLMKFLKSSGDLKGTEDVQRRFS